MDNSKRLEKDEIFNSYFKNLTEKERAVFEGGISMGALFHQFVGTPISMNSKKSLEDAIKVAMENQPFIKKAVIHINLKIAEDDYVSLTGEMLNVILIVGKEKEYKIRLNYIPELNYPLMYVEE
ncbi:dihydroneopterin aldolase family protein [Methanococcus voltae]|uniref:Dihydroneopterin aldolase n=1 Tax=Methanococcus voltae (strain ATCC BAA-1334 / A3) TaxID=456320 RepID=D7DUP9_METV3|nr:dihydroneopterin aldolase family protein [Methanococcus voltae]